MRGVFKVQRPIFPKDSALCLVYNRDRSFVLEIDMQEVRPWFEQLGMPLKLYCEALVAPDGKFFIEALMPDQPW